MEMEVLRTRRFEESVHREVPSQEVSERNINLGMLSFLSDLDRN